MFQWKFLPLRMKTAGGLLQRAIDKILQGLQHYRVAVYINYITVYSLTLDHHCCILEGVFHRRKAASLRVSVSKNCLAQESILALGHPVSVQDWSRIPTRWRWSSCCQTQNKEEIKRFMGMMGLCLWIIPGCSTLGEHLFAMGKFGGQLHLKL